MNIIQKNKCTGCEACANVCPVSAITLIADSEGFLYPNIDNSLCINCNKCKCVCPTLKQNHKEIISSSFVSSFLCFCNDEEVRLNSSSGGVFYPLAMKVIKSGGVVFGAKFDEQWNVVHALATEESGVKAFQVSKYVQSRIGDTYTVAKSCLDKGKPVLFTATPCQIAGLRAYLGKSYPNLLTCDFICHGVPSPSVWQEYVKYREDQAGAKAAKIVFRVKDKGWHHSLLYFSFLNNIENSEYKTKDIYYKGFLNNLFLRPCCHSCSFKGFHRASDITMADAWGIQNYAPSFDNDKGVSLIMINTEKGEKAFKSIDDSITYQRVKKEKPLRYNMNYFISEQMSLRRSRFFSDLKRVGIEKAIENNLKIYDKVFRKAIGTINRVLSKLRS